MDKKEKVIVEFILKIFEFLMDLYVFEGVYKYW